MRRALAIVKYVPAVLCGLLVVAWAWSCFYSASITRLRPHRSEAVRLESGNFFAVSSLPHATLGGAFGQPPNYDLWHYDWKKSEDIETLLGKLEFRDDNSLHPSLLHIKVPLLLLATTLLPFASAPFTRFRFPLWSYFAWAALIAAELAYYLR